MSGEGKVPVVILMYKRDSVVQVVSAVSAYAPNVLYLIADGPRNERDEQLCSAARAAALSAVSWPCQCHTIFRDKNLGCRRGIPEGLTTVFNSHPHAIILEDDTIPAEDFFHFAEDMLIRYAQNESVKLISGTNYLSDEMKTETSYVFSGYAETCGYATWKRAWTEYDADVTDWPQQKFGHHIPPAWVSRPQRRFWKRAFSSLYEKTTWFDSYDFQWLYAVWKHGGVTIVPKENLITNTGNDFAATHTSTRGERFLHRSKGVIKFPLMHPPCVQRNAAFDAEYATFVFPSGGLKATVARMVPRRLLSLVRYIIGGVEK